MPREAACPSQDQLRLLLLGRTPEPEAGSLESHLEGCGRCLRVVRTLPAEDALVEAVRAQRGVEDRPEDEAGRPLIERLQARPPAARGAVPPPEDVPPGDVADPAVPTASLTGDTSLPPAPGPRGGLGRAAPVQEGAAGNRTEASTPLHPSPPRGAPDASAAGGGGRPPPPARAPPPPPPGGAPDASAAGAGDVPAALLEHPRYHILGRLGAGGMGTVYRAEHRLMGRTVALKVISPELVSRPGMVERFRREVQAAARLS